MYVLMCESVVFNSSRQQARGKKGASDKFDIKCVCGHFSTLNSLRKRDQANQLTEADFILVFLAMLVFYDKNDFRWVVTSQMDVWFSKAVRPSILV